MAIIQDSATGLTAKVSVNNRLQVHSIATTEAIAAVVDALIIPSMLGSFLIRSETAATICSELASLVVLSIR